MKKTKFLASILAVAMALLLFPANSVEVSADEPVTFVVQYVDEVNDWRFQNNGTSEWQTSAVHRELYYLYEQMKDGDIVVVYNFNSSGVAALDLGTKKISNLTVADADSPTVIYTGGVDLFFAHNGTSSSINGDVNTAHVYDDATCNFNGNVGTLNFYADGEINSIMGVGGTLGHFHGVTFDGTKTLYDFYNFNKGTFVFYDHGFQTPEGNYSRTPSAVNQPVSTTPAAPSTGSDDYDDVPKTGESHLAMWLLLAATLCAGGSYYAKKKSA